MTDQPPKTHAEASRQRKDIVLGEATDEARLIRFVAGPDGAVVPDLARKLPGLRSSSSATSSWSTKGARERCLGRETR